ncbi:MAG: hypothetical protein WD059_14275 [Balneolaceae bacterium]
MISPSQIFDSSLSFEEKALHIYKLQKAHNPIYKKFCETLETQEIKLVSEIPLLPISGFKDVEIITALDKSSINNFKSTLKFQSSGTSGMKRSKHYVPDRDIYRQSIIRGMQQFYNLEEYVIWAYTPGYQENPNSSLIWMLNTLIEREDSGMSRFLDLGVPLDKKKMSEIKESEKKLMLFGAAFGLLDILEQQETHLPKDSVIMETGGMKTHRREMTRQQLHEKLTEGFGIPKTQIHSEYGMAELLSQAYSLGDEWFQCVPWMQVSIRNPDNPMEELPAGEEGLIGIIDLANIYSCAFILTGDKGIQDEAGKFQVLGRWNPQNLRGCNFLIDQD